MTLRFDRCLRRVVACASLALALSLVLAWAGNLALDQASDSGDAELITTVMSVLGWTELALTVVVVAGLVVGIWRHQLLWAGGVLLIVIGLALHWAWWLVDRRVDVFGVSGLSSDNPILLERLELRLWLTLAIDVLSVASLAIGSILMLRQPSLRRAGRRALDPFEDRDSEDSDAPTGSASRMRDRLTWRGGAASGNGVGASEESGDDAEGSRVQGDPAESEPQ